MGKTAKKDAARLAAVLVVLMVACSADPPAVDEVERVRGALPEQAAGWRAGDGDQVFDTETIFSYIDGHAEVYLAYGMQRCIARRYTGPEGEPDIIVDLYELASDADAYGVFTHDRDGDEVEVGQDGLYRHGWLSFWQGHWFGSIYSEGETETSRRAVLALGEASAAAIGETGSPPGLVAELPPQGLEPRSVKFLHAQEILNGVVYLGFDNPFGLGPDVNAVIGRYELPGGGAWLLLVDYPEEAAAGRAENRAREESLAVRREGTRVAAVLGPEASVFAAELLETAFGGTP